MSVNIWMTKILNRREKKDLKKYKGHYISQNNTQHTIEGEFFFLLKPEKLLENIAFIHDRYFHKGKNIFKFEMFE